MNVEILRASVDHIDDVMTIASESGLSEWSRDHYIGELTLPDTLFIVAKLYESRCSGFITGRMVPDSQSSSQAAEIHNFGVRVEDRRRGVGSCLLRSFMEVAAKRGASRVFLEVRSGNVTAIDFYRKYGFEVYTSRRDYYKDPVEDATLMKSED